MKKVRHRVILYIDHDCKDKPMTEKQTKRWVEKKFEGCDYGQVRVVDVSYAVDISNGANEEKPEAPLSPLGLPLK